MMEQSSSDVVWGIIGCGDVTEVKSGPAFSLVPGSRVAAVMRRNSNKAADYARRHGINKWYDSAEALLSDKEINAVYIATPPSSHMGYAIDALRRGLNVYLEKPVAINALEAHLIAEASSLYGSKLSVAHYRRALPMFLFVKELLEKRVAGDIRSVQIRMWQPERPSIIAGSANNWRLDPKISGGGYFHDLAPHQLDLMVYFFGAPNSIHGFSLNQSGRSLADDHVAGIVLFGNQVTLNCSWSFNVHAQEEVDECIIVGSKGSIRFPFFGKKVTWKNEEHFENQELDFIHPQHIQQPMIGHVVRYFQGLEPNMCSMAEAILSMEIMDRFCEK